MITFLNDNDLWEKNRLSSIAERFAEILPLGFFHNGQTFIGPDGGPAASVLSYALFKHPSGLIRYGEVHLSPEEAAERPWLLRRYEADFNTSSLALRREIVEPNIDELFRCLRYG